MDSEEYENIRVTIIYGWDSIARVLGLLTTLGIVAKLILRHIVHVTLFLLSQLSLTMWLALGGNASLVVRVLMVRVVTPRQWGARNHI